MPAIQDNFVMFAKLAPQPATVEHRGSGDSGYVCHLAVMHWGCRALGYSAEMANAYVSRYTQHTCSACVNYQPAPVRQVKKSFFQKYCPFSRGGSGMNILELGAAHITGNSGIYGQILCANAVKIPNRQQLHVLAKAGDVLITESPQLPMHSMVVVQNTGVNDVRIRGFNNAGTLGQGPAGAYDIDDRNVAAPSFWHGANEDKFGGGGRRLDLFVVKNSDFMNGLQELVRQIVFDWD